MEPDAVNPYAQPRSVVAPPVATTSPALFFVPSTSKLVLMSLVTFNLYSIYWFYKNWALIAPRSVRVVSPFWRAFFGALWAYSLFREIKTTAREHEVHDALPAGPLAIAFFVFQLTSRLPGSLSLVGFVSFLPLVPANNLAARVNKAADPAWTPENRYSVGTWLCLVVGGLLLLLTTIGLLLPPV